MSRPEFKSSRELKRDLSFNDLNILVYTVPWNMNGLCAPRYSRQRVAEKQTSCLEGCPHLAVLFDSITGLCVHERDHFLSLHSLCV